MSLTLLAVLAAADLRSGLAALSDPSMKSARAGDLACILRPSRKRLWRSRAGAGREMVAFQRALETLHAGRPVLPGAPGAEFAKLAEAEAFLDANAHTLGAGLAAYGDLAQHQIVISAPLDLILGTVKNEAAGAMALMAKGDRAGAGKVLQALGQAARAKMGREFLAELSAPAEDVARLPEPDPETVLNAAVLTARPGVAALEAALERIDARFEGALKIRMIGPTPASSFASVTVETIACAEAEAAAARLGVAPDADAATVKRAYYDAMKRAHPDVAGDESAPEAQELAAAHALMKRLAERNTAGAAAAPTRLARLMREGDARAEGA